MGCSQGRLAFDAVAPAPNGNISDDYRHRSDQQSRLSYFGMKMKRGIAPLPIFRKEPKSSSQSIGHGQAVIYNGRFSPQAISGQVSQIKPETTRNPVNATHGVGVNGPISTCVPITKATDSLKGLGLDTVGPKPPHCHPKEGVGVVGGPMISPLLANTGAATNTFDPLSIDIHLATTHITTDNGLQYRDKISDPTNFIAAVKKGDMSTIQTLVTAATNTLLTPGDVEYFTVNDSHTIWSFSYCRLLVTAIRH